MLVALWARLGKARWYIVAGAAALVLVVVAFLVGRSSAPTKTVTVTETKYVDRVVTKEVVREVKVQGPVRVQEKIITRPGAERVVERVIERGPTTTTTDAAASSDRTTVATKETTKIVESPKARWLAEVGGQWSSLTLSPHRWDAAIGMRLAGPFWLSLTDSAPADKLADTRHHALGLRLRAEF